MKKFLVSLFVALCLISISKPASAVPLTLGSGWQEFFFNGVGSAWDTIFDFSVSENSVLTVTDGFLAGDRFEVFNFGSSIGLTSIPTGNAIDQIGTDYDTATSDSRWSSGAFNLGAGTYQISGTVFSSPHSGGRAALRLDRDDSGQDGGGQPDPEVPTNAVPEPASMFLLGSGLYGLVRFKKKV